MSVAFEYIARNYIGDFEYFCLQRKIFGPLAAKAFFLNASFSARVFLLFRQKWLLLIGAFEGECFRTTNEYLHMPLKNREELRTASEAQHRIFGLDRELEWRFLERARREFGSDKLERLANTLGSFDIHLTDTISELVSRSRSFRHGSLHGIADLSLEIATFSHLGEILMQIRREYSHSGDALSRYVQFRYGGFSLSIGYPVSELISKLEELNYPRSVEKSDLGSLQQLDHQSDSVEMALNALLSIWQKHGYSDLGRLIY